MFCASIWKMFSMYSGKIVETQNVNHVLQKHWKRIKKMSHMYKKCTMCIEKSRLVLKKGKNKVNMWKWKKKV